MSAETDDAYAYASITPLNLSASTTYVIGSSETASGDSWHDTQSFTLGSEISSIFSYYGTGSYPDTAGNPNESYVPCNFQYSIT